jgi:hypothetical protein
MCTSVSSGEKTEGEDVRSGVVKHITNCAPKANVTLVPGHGCVALFEFTDPFDEDRSDVGVFPVVMPEPNSSELEVRLDKGRLGKVYGAVGSYTFGS